MENKKLVNILIKDMGELEDLISDIKMKGNFDALEFEFVHTRAKGILQLLQMLNGFDSPAKSALEIVESEKATTVIPLFKNKIEEKKENINSEEETIEDYHEGQVTNGEEFSVPEITGLNETHVIVETVEMHDIQTEQTIETTVDSDPITNNGNEIELEEEIVEPGHRLGDSFLKGKSVNDLVDDHINLEHKLSNRPVSSIQAAIGINDRFQYIRELFEGSSDKFFNTVSSLDSMNNINEAVAYLQQNFKWKKNETSLKFVNLVKRRFINE